MPQRGTRRSALPLLRVSRCNTARIDIGTYAAVPFCGGRLERLVCHYAPGGGNASGKGDGTCLTLSAGRVPIA